MVSTCNRVEFYVSGSRASHRRSVAKPGRLLALVLGTFALKTSSRTCIVMKAPKPSCHLFRVASSLDSMVLGEPQILGQVKEAYRHAVDHAAAGTIVRRVFEKAFSVAKRVRTETGRSRERGFDELRGRRARAGDLRYSRGSRGPSRRRGQDGNPRRQTLSPPPGVSSVRVASRSLATAQRLADEIGAQASSMGDVPVLMQSADIVICSTAAPTFVIDKPMIAKVVPKRRYRPILFVDIAVPRDVDPKVAELDNVFVYDVDDLEAVLEVNRENRAHEAAAADRLIRDELERYVRWSRSQQVVPVIKALRSHASTIAGEEAQRTLSGLKEPDKKTAQSVKAMSNAIVNKLLHPVLTRLKSEGADGDPQVLIESLVTLFELDVEAAPPRAESTPKTACRCCVGPQIIQRRWSARRRP